jgi:hypothetical protein
MAARLPGLRHADLQARTRRALALPGVRMVGGVILALLLVPWYLRYFVWATGQCGIAFWAPIQ